MENKPTRGSGNYLGLLIIAVLFFTVFSPMLRSSFSSRGTAYTREEFAKDLQEEQVERVEISPNKDNTTGYVTVIRKDGDKEILYATVIAELEEMLRHAVIHNEEESDKGLVTLGSIVVVHDYTYDEDVEYRIVGSNEADPMEGKISDLSPIGAAIIGHKAKDVVTFETPKGESKLKIKSVKNYSINTCSAFLK